MKMQQTKLKTIYTREYLAGLVIVLALMFMPVVTSVPALQLPGVNSIVAAAEEKDTDLGPITNNTACPKGDCIIKKYIQPGVNLMAALVGLAVTVSIISAGIRYASSADSPQKVSEAKTRIVTSIFVLIGFFVFYAFMNYLIPGGLV